MTMKVPELKNVLKGKPTASDLVLNADAKVELLSNSLDAQYAELVSWSRLIAAHLENTKEKADSLEVTVTRLMQLDAIARSAQAAANDAATKIDALKAALVLLADRVEQNDLTGLKADIQAALA